MVDSMSTDAGANRKLLAIFAHPDDELFISPVLHRYAQEGVDCHLAIVTDGRFGIQPHMNGLAGDELAEYRSRELDDAARELGIHPPVQLNYVDGYAHKTPDLKNALADLSAIYNDILRLIQDLQPDVLITFGPDGVYGHPDHMAVGNVVTMVYQTLGTECGTRLYHTGLCIQDFPMLFEEDSEFADRNRFGLDERHLPVKVAFSTEDAEAAHRSLSCHQSQFTQTRIDQLCRVFHQHGYIRFRAWDGSHGSEACLFAGNADD